MERVEETLSALMPALESHEIGSWETGEVELLCAMLKEYGAQARASAAKKANTTATSSADEEESEEGDDEGDEEMSDEEEDEEALFVAAVGEVDRGLARTRDFLKSRLPYGAHPEPTQIPRVETASKKRARSPENTTEASSTALVTAPVYAVDSFLYAEDDINELVEAKQIAREYCARCGCTDIHLAEFITHSFSQDQLVYLSCFLFPHVLRQVISASVAETDTAGPLHIVDVGSRLGVVLWACALALQQGALVQPPSEADEDDDEEEEEEEPEVHITGVEMDPAYVKLSHDVLRRFFTPRRRQAPRLDKNDADPVEEVMDVSSQLHVIQSDCFVGDGAAALKDASLIVLHNVFEYFCSSPVAHAACWLKLRRLVGRRGRFLVCSPALEETLSGFTADVWAAAWAEVEGAEKKGAAVVPPLQWLASFVERVDVTAVSDNFLTMRALARDHGDGAEEGSESDCCGDDGCDAGNGHGHSHGGHGHSHGHSHDGHGHSHGHSHGAEEHDDEAESEVAEGVQNIYVYRVL